jgi:hypothetical protein
MSCVNQRDTPYTNQWNTLEKLRPRPPSLREPRGGTSRGPAPITLFPT